MLFLHSYLHETHDNLLQLINNLLQLIMGYYGKLYIVKYMILLYLLYYIYIYYYIINNKLYKLQRYTLFINLY
jgi:hypothetical protein